MKQSIERRVSKLESSSSIALRKVRRVIVNWGDPMPSARDGELLIIRRIIAPEAKA